MGGAVQFGRDKTIGHGNLQKDNIILGYIERGRYGCVRVDSLIVVHQLRESQVFIGNDFRYRIL